MSQLKKHVGLAKTQSQLPIPDEASLIAKEPINISGRRLVKKQGKAITEVLVKWRNTFLEDSTWETLTMVQQKYPDFDKDVLKGKVFVSSQLLERARGRKN